MLEPGRSTAIPRRRREPLTGDLGGTLPPGSTLAELRATGRLGAGTLGRSAAFELAARAATELHARAQAGESVDGAAASLLLRETGAVEAIAGGDRGAADAQLQLGLVLLNLLVEGPASAGLDGVRCALGEMPLGDPALPVLLRMLAPGEGDRFPSLFDAAAELSRLATDEGPACLRREASSLLGGGELDESECLDATILACGTSLDESALLDAIDTGRMERPAFSPLPTGDSWASELPLASMPGSWTEPPLVASEDLLDSTPARPPKRRIAPTFWSLPGAPASSLPPELAEPVDEWGVEALDRDRTLHFEAASVSDLPAPTRGGSKTLPYSPAFVPKAATWRRLAALSRPPAPSVPAEAAAPESSPEAAAVTDAWASEDLVRSPVLQSTTPGRSAPKRRRRRRRTRAPAPKPRSRTFGSLRSIPARRSALKNSPVLAFVSVVVAAAVLTMSAHLVTRWIAASPAPTELPPAETDVLAP